MSDFESETSDGVFFSIPISNLPGIAEYGDFFDVHSINTLNDIRLIGIEKLKELEGYNPLCGDLLQSYIGDIAQENKVNEYSNNENFFFSPLCEQFLSQDLIQLAKNTPITQLNLPIRSKWLLDKFDIRSVFSLLSLDIDKLNQCRNTGTKTIRDIKEQLAKFIRNNSGEALNKGDYTYSEFLKRSLDKYILNIARNTLIKDLSLPSRAKYLIDYFGVVTVADLLAANVSDKSLFSNVGKNTIKSVQDVLFDFIESKKIFPAIPDQSLNKNIQIKLVQNILSNISNLKLSPENFRGIDWNDIYSIILNDNTYKLKDLKISTLAESLNRKWPVGKSELSLVKLRDVCSGNPFALKTRKNWGIKKFATVIDILLNVFLLYNGYESRINKHKLGIIEDDLSLDELINISIESLQNPKLQNILLNRFGLNESRTVVTLEALAKEMNITRERVRQQESLALKKIKDNKLLFLKIYDQIIQKKDFIQEKCLGENIYIIKSSALRSSLFKNDGIIYAGLCICYESLEDYLNEFYQQIEKDWITVEGIAGDVLDVSNKICEILNDLKVPVLPSEIVELTGAHKMLVNAAIEFSDEIKVLSSGYVVISNEKLNSNSVDNKKNLLLDNNFQYDGDLK